MFIQQALDKGSKDVPWAGTKGTGFAVRGLGFHEESRIGTVPLGASVSSQNKMKLVCGCHAHLPWLLKTQWTAGLVQHLMCRRSSKMLVWMECLLSQCHSERWTTPSAASKTVMLLEGRWTTFTYDSNIIRQKVVNSSKISQRKCSGG